MRDLLAELRIRLEHVADLQDTAALLGWDQATYMPAGGSQTRGRQLATIARLAHEALVDPAIGSLLDRLEPELESIDPDSDEARLISVTRFDYDRATQVPAHFLAEFEKHASHGYQLWVQARPADDFALVADHLERTVELSRRYSSFFSGYQHVADALIDESDRGMTVARLRPLFRELRARLLPLVDATTAGGGQAPGNAGSAREVADGSPLRACYPEAAQIAFGEEVIRAFGFDFRRGRQDRSGHPFATALGDGDVRITTRVREADLSEALFSSLHEAGHGMYEQGIDPGLHGTPLAGGTSAGVHESQSRLWENVVGRSYAFWRHYFPLLRERFPDQLTEVSLEAFYAAVNLVSRSLIRTDADELTYNLHVMIRFELECELLEGTLAVADLADAWRERYRSDLGVDSGGDSDGVLQDMHWFSGLVGGAFQGYTIGNILSAQFYAAASKAQPDLPEQMASGSFGGLHAWLKENIWRHGRKYTPDELLLRATGSEMSIEPYLAYLSDKYRRLYPAG
ncbi:MAG: carboxypeptidase M32 [Trueperaceae bacterium]